jgi:GT2 family glycosyltransferase
MIGEDTEFCARLLRAGDKIVYALRAIVYHPVPKARAKKSHFQLFSISLLQLRQIHGAAKWLPGKRNPLVWCADVLV